MLMNLPDASVNVAGMLVGTDSANSVSTKEAIENDVEQVENLLTMTSLPYADGIALSDTKLAAVNAGKRLHANFFK